MYRLSLIPRRGFISIDMNALTGNAQNQTVCSVVDSSQALSGNKQSGNQNGRIPNPQDWGCDHLHCTRAHHSSFIIHN
jgi:hypothetical protein